MINYISYIRYSQVDFSWTVSEVFLLVSLNLFFLVLFLQYRAITIETDKEKEEKIQKDSDRASKIRRLYPDKY